MPNNEHGIEEQLIYLSKSIYHFISNSKEYSTLLAEIGSWFDDFPGMDIYLFDNNYRYIISGGKEKSSINLSNRDLIGKTMFEVFDKKIQRSIFPFYHKVLNGEPTEGEVRFGNSVYHLMAAPVKNNENKTIAGILISQNVTNDKLFKAHLKKGKAEALKADRSKSIFIANLSHEMRTPLNAIIGFSEQLEKTGLSDVQLKYLSMIKNASDQLLYLVTEVVFLFKLGMGRVFIEKKPFSTDDLFGELNDLFLRQAGEKKLLFTIDKDGNIPESLIGDPYRLRQILMNLLVNAIKYTDNGEVRLSCLIRKEYEQKIKIDFKVSDTGVGISKDDISRIFNVFEQGTKLTANFRGGAGLGLGICDSLIKLLNGKITVKSKVGQGTVFTVTLPFDKVSEHISMREEELFKIKDEYLTGKNILLADDDEQNLLLVSLMLKNWKTNLIIVQNGEEALQHLTKSRFDIALLDIHMPKFNGVEVIRALRSNNENPNYKIPVLAITASAIKGDIHKYLKAGFDDYLIKPFREADLYNKLCNMLGPEWEIKAGPVNSYKKKRFLTDAFNMKELLDVANGEKDFYSNMLNNFINNANMLKEVFETCKETGNWEEAGEKSHKAIPSFKYFGLLQIVSQLEIIEDLTLRKKDYKNLLSITNDVLEKINIVGIQAVSLKERFD